MNRLLAALGCGAAAAWVGGLILALGPLTVPGNLHVLQYASFYLPAVALGLTRLRERPEFGRAVVLGLTLLAAVFSSYYMAVLAGVTGGVWGALELARPGPRRARFALGALVAASAALGLLAVTSMPYFESPSGGMATPRSLRGRTWPLRKHTCPGRRCSSRWRVPVCSRSLRTGPRH
jgi:hypothetical protein